MLRVLATFLFCTCVFSVSLFAQDRAAIDGMVRDASGAVIPNAIVELDSPETGLHLTAVTSPA
ncbi:MAG TPA: carboxypeptidase-like regulatory domain-containing protein [Terriglobia bacterium]|jgi:hypothetical protein